MHCNAKDLSGIFSIVNQYMLYRGSLVKAKATTEMQRCWPFHPFGIIFQGPLL